ncbi:MAG: cellulase family glycosylhydrolase [Oscillospiraceae bacterium]|nr:cellulase family glycosylhydrolase [Oscillospiraceae bacterium]
MKKTMLKKLAAIAAASGIIAAGTAGRMPVSEVSAVPDEYHDDWLHVEGTQILDMNGNPVWLTGCNWFGYNVGSQVFDGVWSQNMHEMLNQIADHGFNLLRVPMSTELLLQWKNGDPDPAPPKVNEYSNPELTIEGVEGGTVMYSFDIWNYAVEWCRENGIKIMIDIHCAETASAGHQVSLWYTDKFSTEDWYEALEWVADYYKDDDTIIAIDLKNEPHGTADTPDLMAKWDDSTDPNNWKYAAEGAAAAVFRGNPNLLVMVEGTEVYPREEYDWTYQNIDYSRYPFSYYYHTWWGANFRGAREFPIDLGEHQDKLVYSPHDYGPLVFEQTWFEGDFTKETLLEDCWYDNWFYLQDEGVAPLLIGEWGGFIDEEHDTDGKNTKWMLYLRELIIDNKINHTFWCFNENSGDTGGLVYDNFGKWDEEKYALVEKALWQDESGKFISLDHKIPLGKSGNGISLSDYYSGGTNTGSDVISGDVNDDKLVNSMDSVIMRKYLFGSDDKAVNINTVNADMNSDSEVGIADLVILHKYLLQRTS